jgi:hypothetical protein
MYERVLGRKSHGLPTCGECFIQFRLFMQCPGQIRVVTSIFWLERQCVTKGGFCGGKIVNHVAQDGPQIIERWHEVRL